MESPGSNGATEEAASETLAGTYAKARLCRAVCGHDAAVSLYRSLLADERGKSDMSAASRIAAAHSSPRRHDSVFAQGRGALCGDMESDAVLLRRLLVESHFTAERVHDVFGIAKGLRASGPLCVRPVTAGGRTLCPFSFPPTTKERVESSVKGLENGSEELSLRCLIALFVLGFALPKSTLSRSLLGSDHSVQLLHRLGFIFPCELDDTLMVPYVQLFPLDVKLVQCPAWADVSSIGFARKAGENLSAGADKVDAHQQLHRSLVFVTDWHPSVLSSTAVGESRDGAVMYIGPDSLALVQHLPPVLHLSSKTSCTRILDLCCGSGIQGIATMAALELVEKNYDLSHLSRTVSVDINERALKFTRFNALLNGFGKRLVIVKGDIVAWNEAMSQTSREEGNNFKESFSPSSNEFEKATPRSGFNIILSNPPFIPTPTLPESMRLATERGGSQPRNHSEAVNKDSLNKKYGLFSSGEIRGEDIVRSVVRLAPRLLSRDPPSLLGIVSEFMNPGERLRCKIQHWWQEGVSRNSNDAIARKIGIVFTNEFPIPAEAYAWRRAGNIAEEFGFWQDHLDNQGITHISPGLLFVAHKERQNATDGSPKDERECGRDKAGSGALDLRHRIVPKTLHGSIWTPHNLEAVKFTSEEWETLTAAPE